jgi:inner membrane transporter RhtA
LRLHFVAVLAVIVAMISIQFGATLAKQLFAIIGVANTAAYRTSMAAVILLVLVRPWQGPRLSRAAIGNIAAYGTALGAMNLLFYHALSRIPLGVGVALEFVGPLGLAIFMSRRPIDLVWAGLALCGILLVHDQGLSQNGQELDPLGVAFALGASICWALYIVCGRRAISHVASRRASAYGALVAAVVVLPFSQLESYSEVLSLGVWPYAMLVALFSSAIPYTLEMKALTRLPTKTFGVLMSLEPVFAALLGHWFLSEALGLSQMLAIGAIIVASMGSILTHRTT